MRSGGFLAAGHVQDDGKVAEFFRLAPGNLFIAFVATACPDGGLPSIVGRASAFCVMALTRKQWAALAGGFMTAYVTHFLAPTLVGNMIGGIALAALLNHAPVAHEIAENAPRASKQAPNDRHSATRRDE